MGDALGAPLEFLDAHEIRRLVGADGIRDYWPAYGRRGAITDDTQMTLFTAEGLIRADNRMRDRGLCNVPAVIHRAYRRWLATQGEKVPDDWEMSSTPTGWLVTIPELQHRRAPGSTCLSALRDPTQENGEPARNSSKGCGGVMRVAPIGLVADDRAFQLACESAALTHGHPSGYLAAGAFAHVVAEVFRGATLARAAHSAISRLVEEPDSDEVVTSLQAALAASDRPPSQASLQKLGEGWVAEEALAIGMYAAVQGMKRPPPEAFLAGVSLAVSHGGDSDSTGSIAGNLLGTMLGMQAIPTLLLDELECREVVASVAEDLISHFVERQAPPSPSNEPLLESWPTVSDGDRYPPF